MSIYTYMHFMLIIMDISSPRLAIFTTALQTIQLSSAEFPACLAVIGHDARRRADLDHIAACKHLHRCGKQSP